MRKIHFFLELFKIAMVSDLLDLNYDCQLKETVQKFPEQDQGISQTVFVQFKSINYMEILKLNSSVQRSSTKRE